MLSNKILIGTHHKTGTLWFHKIFQGICRKFVLSYHTGNQARLPDDFDVFMQDHSKFDLQELKEPYRGVHIIRDPRDRIVSGAFYHQRSKERWLHTKKGKYGGMSYQQKLCSLSSLEDKIAFEMNNAACKTIGEMRCWDYKNSNFIEVKYEELILDLDLMQFHRIFSFLGFDGRSIPAALQIAWENSLFSGELEKSGHIRSGEAEQWKTLFTAEHKRQFVDLFGDALIELGYEQNNDWALS